MDPRSDPSTIWSYLKEGLDDIMSGVDMSFQKNMSLYSTAYNYCLASRVVPDVSQGVLSEDQPQNKVRTFLDLYHRLSTYYGNYVSELRNQSDALQGEELLQYYVAQWSNYTSRIPRVNNIFSKLNQLVKPDMDAKRRRMKNAHKSDIVPEESRESFYPINLLALVQWKSHFLIPQQQQLIPTLLHLIEVDRESGQVDNGLIKKVIDSMTTVGINQKDSSKTDLDVYTELFEVPFLEATEQYYARKSDVVRKERSDAEYLKWVEERLRDEEKRVEQYLNTETREPLIETCELILSVKGSA
ncbi:hypothetical protein SERLA73DRAFT_147680 [Serpula lacrymans var. lacrymans S7.3]|uniref:Cullin N-terminal domain-containing protein n=2 Tax=Serpula lacrymans var. lacrymans TaxID=341189 RepID=F8QHT5_SERL3|nr:uncharacterized protein SERLADRAFT_409180 [Serpula lacrymans var. lacrymans S7.9]EGN92131.1 hypothetical protein SERLA73DRAFT_147680 [Serpula lacrymans var. lacrymans S7.3]EGO23985.1 hypothetical protein SERLADRAFT_409180 [Serpula lacrymans var. lacrymans S7.9]